MIRVVAHDKADGHPMVLLGLMDENLKRLQEDKPIRVNLRELIPGQHTDLPNVSVVIFHATADSEAWLAHLLPGESGREQSR